MSSSEQRDILLIEDNAANIMVATGYLDFFNYSYVVATDGAKGVDQFKLYKFQLVLMDIQMPGMSGTETTKHIRQMEKASGAKATPIVAMTAGYKTSDFDKWLEVGIEDMIPKPLNVKYFERILAKYCNKKV